MKYPEAKITWKHKKGVEVNWAIIKSVWDDGCVVYASHPGHDYFCSHGTVYPVKSRNKPYPHIVELTGRMVGVPDFNPTIKRTPENMRAYGLC